ncbi:hypothetical protein Leryth_008694 [Lithospermum erythrorhizon]|nr:hypothetical protein Leryth_008694 [Lithospermum erythrorhizon]
MSTDPQLHSEIRLQNTIIKIESLSSTSSYSDVVSNVDNVFGTIESRKASNDDDEEGFHTPTSPKHMIPKSLSCPPAPRKPTRFPSCKRKLNFFEATSKDEIENFFKRVEEARQKVAEEGEGHRSRTINNEFS